MQNYQELIVWQKAHALVLRLYDMASRMPKEEVFGLTNQIKRSVVSIPANIAEGCGKYSNKDFANFLQVSLGSTNETEYYLLLIKDLKYIKQEEYINLWENINQIKAMLISLIEKVRSK